MNTKFECTVDGHSCPSKQSIKDNQEALKIKTNSDGSKTASGRSEKTNV